MLSSGGLLGFFCCEAETIRQYILHQESASHPLKEHWILRSEIMKNLNCKDYR